MTENEEKKNKRSREEIISILDKCIKKLVDAKKSENQIHDDIIKKFDSISDPLEKAAKAKELISVLDGYLAKHRDRLPLRIKEALVQRQYGLSKIL